MAGPPRLAPYDPQWPVAAAEQLRRLRDALAGAEDAARFEFDHIGSTAVPGLRAKPVLDLQIRVPRLDRSERFDAMLEVADYLPAQGSRPDSPGVHRDTPRGSGNVPDRVWDKRLFFRADPCWPSILHIRLAASPWGRHTVDFRNWLRAHPDQREDYQRVKLELAAAHAADPDYDDYTRAKTAYFDRVQPQFERWAAVGHHRRCRDQPSPPGQALGCALR